MEIRRRPPNPKVKVAFLEYAIPHEDEAPRHILEEIVWAKDREVAVARERVPSEKLKQQVAELPEVDVDPRFVAQDPELPIPGAVA